MSDENVIQDSYRSRVRSCGMSPDYWYPAALSKDLAPLGRQEVVFWKQSIVVFRTKQGEVHALEDRCAHRHLKLSGGEVKGCRIVCEYHGWEYDGDGQCAHIPHETRVRSLPVIRVRSYPVKEKYGIIWFFPGDPEKAAKTPLPSCPQLDGPEGWPYIPLEFTWQTHHTMIMENVCDFYHEHLHRKYKPFYKPKLVRAEETPGDRVEIEYETSFRESQIVRLAGDKRSTRLDSIKLFYDYPYQRSDIDGKYLHWLFVTPIDERTTRAFFVFAFGAITVPIVEWHLPMWARYPILKAANMFYVEPLLNEDGKILEMEMKAHLAHRDKPSFEFNPVVKRIQALSLRKWEEHLARQATGGRPTTGAPHSAHASQT